MRKTKSAFTLLELLISIVILSIMVMYLYHSYNSLNRSNQGLHIQTNKIMKREKIKKLLYLDFLNAGSSVKITHREKNEDFVVLQTTHSIHRRFHPYVLYMLKEDKLYRLESLKKIASYEIASDALFDVDYLGKCRLLRVYKSSKKDANAYLIHINFKKMEEIILKVKVF